MSGSIWERFPYDPRQPEHATLRASDRDQVARAKTLGELPAVLHDLVAPTSASTPAIRDTRAEAERRYRQQRRQSLYSFLTPTLICWIIYVSVLLGGGGTWFPWPVFVTIGTGMRFFQLTTSREDSIVSIERDLEKKERKRLEEKQRTKNKSLPAADDDADGTNDPF